MTPAQIQAVTPLSARPETTDLDAEVFDRDDDEHLDADTLEAALGSLLEIYPEAPVAAHKLEGLIVEMPDSVPLLRNPVLEANSTLDLLMQDTILKGWERVVRKGASRYTIQPLTDPDLRGMVYALDLRETHGVIFTLTVFWTPDGSDASGELPPLGELTPRFATMRKDETAIIVQIDEAVTEILGWSSEEMVGRRSLEFIHPDDQALAVENWLEMPASEGHGRRVRLRHHRKDNSWVWLEVINHNLLEDPDYGCVVSEMVDISVEMAAQEELKARERLLDGLAEAIPVGLFQVDADGEIVYTNDRLHEILAVEPADRVPAQLATLTVADRSRVDGAVAEALGERSSADIEVELHLPSTGELRFCTISLRPLSREDGTIEGAIACVADITDSARMREELKRRATFDELTGCYNRASIMQALEDDIASGQRQAGRAVVFIDLDLFKTINDEQGHAAGDELLENVALRLQDVVRDGDMVGRIGGDEFLVVCPNIESSEQAMKLARRLAVAQREAVAFAGGGAIVVQASIGVAWSTGEGADADAMVAKADAAMYESKRQELGQPKLAS